MVADPQLDEDRIAQTLTDTSILLTPSGVRSLMSLVLMACYDRKVQREFMAEMIDATCEVGIIMSQMEGAAKMRAALTLLKPSIPPKAIDEELDRLVGVWNTKRAIVARKFDLVRACPTSRDRIS